MKSSHLLLVGALCASSATLHAQTSSWVMTLGHDTTGVEQYSRSGNTITGDLIVHTGGPVTVQHYVYTLNADGTPASLNVTYSRVNAPAGARPLQASTVFRGDSVIETFTRDTAVVRRFAAHNAWPVVFGLAQSMGVYEPMFAHLRAAKMDSTPIFAVLAVGGPRAPDTATVTFHGGDSARFWLFGYGTDARLDRRGNLVGLSGRATTQKIEVVRAQSLDIQKMAAAFAAADASGKGLAPVVSAKDSVRATVGGAHISVDYFRPLARGRNVFSNGVLGDTIWRLGANSATAFKTDRDLVIGNNTIPAGSYTIWMRAPKDNSHYDLIFNKQTGQWGTEYHADRDLVRVPIMTMGRTSPMEAFQISVESTGGNAGLIRMSWTSLDLMVPFTVK